MTEIEEFERDGPYVRFMTAPQTDSGLFRAEVWLHIDHVGSVAAASDHEEPDVSWVSDGNETYRVHGASHRIVRALNWARRQYLEEDVP